MIETNCDKHLCDTLRYMIPSYDYAMEMNLLFANKPEQRRNEMTTYEEKCEEMLDYVFEYQAPTQGKVEAYKEIRQAAKHFARVILACTPSCPDQSAAIRKLREAVMTANAAIALDGKGNIIPRKEDPFVKAV